MYVMSAAAFIFHTRAFGAYRTATFGLSRCSTCGPKGSGITAAKQERRGQMGS